MRGWHLHADKDVLMNKGLGPEVIESLIVFGMMILYWIPVGITQEKFHKVLLPAQKKKNKLSKIQLSDVEKKISHIKRKGFLSLLIPATIHIII